MTNEYDFIIVGAGAAGCAIASLLSRSARQPSVLLLEAGGRNDDPTVRIDGDRYTMRMAPGMNWGYKSVPQKHLKSRAIDLDRGKGLSGSTAINFSCWNVGVEGDFDELERLTGDEGWSWKNCVRRLNQLEDFHVPDKDTLQGLEKWCNPRPEDHGKGGPLKIGFPKVWAEKSILDMMDVLVENGYQIKTDIGTGDNLGVAIYPNSAFEGYRTTAADLLVDAPKSLTVLTNSQVHKVNFDGKRAIGVTLLDGTTFSASKEVILSGGSLDTPKVLLLSGIGPKDQLDQFSIPIIHENVNVGQNMMDHYLAAPTWQRKEEASIRPTLFKDPSRREQALKQWETDRTGPLAEIMCMFALGFFKDEAIYNSAEFNALPEERKRHLKAPTVPSEEFVIGGPSAEYFLDPQNTPAVESIFMILQNMESKGEVRLQSSNPSEPLQFDPRAFSHPFDRRVAIEATRKVLKIANSPAFQKDTIKMLHGPASDSEEDIMDYWRERAGSSWHMSGTCKMGRREIEDEAVVDTNFKVFGVENLRVADMSVLPIIVNNHTMTTAYVAGMIAAEKIINEHQLDT